MPIQKVTRDEILQKALGVFKRQGYHRTTMDDLARACGLLKGSFYYYFDSKETLMKEVLWWVNRTSEQRIFSVAYQHELPPDERLGLFLDRLYAAVLVSEGGCIMGNTVLETAMITDEFKEPMLVFFTNWTNAVAHIYETAYPTAQALKLAQQLAAEIEGSLLLVKLGSPESLLRDCRERAINRLNVPMHDCTSNP
ncbi:putative HTH-type transcriptional regulator in lacX 3'region AltName: Full=ORF3 [Fibrisoma limi BUZ 3]|uniref:WGS project CAIT00000000 data, contig 9 n=1 Tax=Fibrisoma limi BUZ 3 TaxID=1185876 RepID=I2GQ36_9BACT|nr:TetR/AcrR family transcriptional regulator [Fibrisoma limi]CCH56014.1 putative HTH-type transcriptional regulator in lacX 3'region AltName: Full=ORF3 [Fibrisoma limi BUZ 3]